MRLRPILAVVAAATLLVVPVSASANSKLVLRLTAGHPSPVDFTSGTDTAVGTPRTVDRAERLRRNETVQVIWHTGADALQPSECPCDGTAGLRPERGTTLRNVVVAAWRGDEMIATAPAERVQILGRRPGDLEVRYRWASDEPAWPRGTRVVVYGLFVRS